MDKQTCRRLDDGLYSVWLLFEILNAEDSQPLDLKYNVNLLVSMNLLILVFVCSVAPRIHSTA